MSDLNVMLREQARIGLQSQLDVATTNGDTEAARQIADKIAKFDVDMTPPKVIGGYGDAEIIAALGKKAEWFGVDPEKSGLAKELGKNLDPKKFATPELFADALIAAVDKKMGATVKPKAGEEDDGDEDMDDEDEDEDEETQRRAAPARRRTDAPGDNDMTGRARGRTSGPWTKLSDAPRDVQAEINRTADKFAPKTKEGREGYITKALGAHYAQHQRTKGKK